MRVCRRCHKTLPDSAFSTIRGKKTGTCTACCRDESNKTYRRLRHKDPVGFWAAKTVITARYRAKKRGREFSLEAKALEEMWEKQGGRCFYCSRKLELGKTVDADNPLAAEPSSGVIATAAASLDRVVNSIGYVATNVVIACGDCNAKKSDCSLDELKAFTSGIERFLLMHGLKH